MHWGPTADAKTPNIKKKIQAHYGLMHPRHRYRSWENNFDSAALQLGFYLASWGRCIVT